MKEKLPLKEYRKLLTHLKGKIFHARQIAYRSANRHLMELYLCIGENLYEKVELSQWGEAIIERLSSDLRQSFPDMKGLSKENLWRMKKIYETYRQDQKLSTLLTELSWSHNLLIINSANSTEEREFYLKAAIHEYWSVRELERQIDSSLYERYMLSQKMNHLIPHTKSKDISVHFKDEYVLDFLGLKDEFKEKDLRKAILANLKSFILEFGRYFTFIGEEYKMTIGDEDCFVDLLFYHRVLRCCVAVELKAGKFKPEYVGKMQFYLAALDEKARLNDENPSVGLILCKSKDTEVVRIALSKAVSPMKVATYKTKLIDRKLLKQKLHSLPLPESAGKED